MSTITSLILQTQLAEAAYANFLDDAGQLITTDAQLRTALTTGGVTFSSAQVDAFAEEWRVIDQFSDTETGFSATLFESQANSGQYVFAE